MSHEAFTANFGGEDNDDTDNRVSIVATHIHLQLTVDISTMGIAIHTPFAVQTHLCYVLVFYLIKLKISIRYYYYYYIIL